MNDFSTDASATFTDMASASRQQTAANLRTSENKSIHSRVQLDYWLRKLSGELPLVELPLDRTRPPVQSHRVSREFLELDQALSDALADLSRRAGVTLFTTLLATFAVQLHRYSSQPDILLGTTGDRREQEETRKPIDRFINYLVLRLDLSGNPGFMELLPRVQSVVLEAAEHSELPFENLVEVLQPERDRSRHPIFQVAFALEESINDAPTMLTGSILNLPDMEGRASSLDLSIDWVRKDRKLSASFTFNLDLFEASTQARIAKHQKTLLWSIVSAPEQRIGELPLLSATEQQQMLFDWNQTQKDFPDSSCLHELFETHVEESPDNIAVISEQEQVTYRELNRRANKLAHWLGTLGVGSNVAVAICMERSVELVVGLMGILKAGGGYLPLDPAYPPERLSFLLEDAQARVLLTQQRLIERLPPHGAKTVSIDGQWESIAQMSEENLDGVAGPEHLAYIIYTSGSTGRPKGVTLDHRGRVNNFSDFNRRFGVAVGDRLLALSSFSFDMSAYDVFGTLAAGATVVLPAPARMLDPAHWAELIASHGITIWHSVPAMLEMFVTYVADLSELRPHSLRLALLGGDWIPVSLPDRIKSLAGEIKVISLGGATEASMDSTIYQIEATDPTWKNIPYGVPMANQLAYVLDKHLQPLPVGVSGELHLGGLGLAWGYFNRPELTAEKFIPNPFSQRPGERLYKTGDLVRYRSDGNLELLGRMDFQVKIRGFRIELGEIAAALRQHPWVQEALVLAREDEPGNKRLVGYVVPHRDVAAITFRPLHPEKESSGNRLEHYELPNGMTIAHLNKAETDFLYEEIFEERTYLKHGITLDDNSCIFDVGANIGLFLLFVSQYYPGAKIYAFEPIPQTFHILQANAALYSLNSELFQCGLSREEKSETFSYYPHFSVGSGRLSDPLEMREVIKNFLSNVPQAKSDDAAVLDEKLIDELLNERLTCEQVVCPLRTISQVIQEQRIQRIDLLKIDVEKSELDVLAGISKQDWPKIRQLVLEVHGKEQLERSVSLLEENGYRLTIEQSDHLQGTALYNIYAARALDVTDSQREALKQPHLESTVRPSNPQQLTTQLQLFLKEKLPEYMMPSAFVFLQGLPLTPNGKVDRKSLPAPETKLIESNRTHCVPRTPVEEVLAGIWSRVLGGKEVSVDDDFFDLGGHSLLAAQLISRVRGIFQVELSMRAVFEASTLAALAEKIEAALREEQSLIIPPIIAVPRTDSMPTSYAQQRLWFVDRLAPNNTAYNIPAAMRLRGSLDLSALERSFNEILSRHETLRTSFAVDNRGEPVQVIASTLDCKIALVDLSDLTESKREATLKELVMTEADRPFDLYSAPLLRVQLLKLREDEHVLLLVMHHSISDGWSMGVLIRELTEIYSSLIAGEIPSLAPLPIQYADFALWQRHWLQSGILDTQLAYWKRQLVGAADLELPTDRPRPPVQTYNGATLSFLLPESLSQNLKELSRREGVTLYMLLLAAFQTLLHRYSGQQDIVVGTPVANRHHTILEGLIGFFVNMLVMRVRLSGDTAFKQLLSQVREVALDAYMHQDVPFERLVDELHRRRNLSRHPLFQVAFALQNAPTAKLELPAMEVELLTIEERTAKFDLTLLMEETEQGLGGTFSYNTDLFDADTAGRMLQHLQRMLEAIVSNPGLRLMELPLLTEAERHQLLFEWNETGSDYDKGHCLHELFEAQAEKRPEATAIIFEGERLSYGELNRRANHLAHFLRERGIGPERLVAVLMERSARMMVSFLAVLKAGGAYVPLDPSYPQERLRLMLDDAQPAVILTEEKFVRSLPQVEFAKLICLDAERDLIEQQRAMNPNNLSGIDDLAYVIYTSGSTGRPKGVCVTHRAIERLVLNTNYAQLGTSDRVAQVSNASFDAITFELWGSLLNGGQLIGIAKEVVLSPRELGLSISEHGITALFLTAALFNQLASEVPDTFRHVRHLLVGGEALDARWIKRVLDTAPPERLLNGYGPTENTTFSICHLIASVADGAKTVPIGRPISNTQAYILDEELNPVPIGVAGELYLGGDGLARCYLNDPQLTAERFIPHPFSSLSGARLYRTGDVARYFPGGQIEFIGRNDQQVKIRGFRIEPGEIEAVLNEHDQVRDSAVIVRADERGEKRLVAYLVLQAGASFNSREWRSYLQQRLPEYMVPQAYVQLDTLPLTENGKLDRRALPEPELGWSNDEQRVSPRNAVEELMADIWAEVLGLESRQLAVGDNFFELGGHSLLATQVVSRVRGVFGVEMPVREVFQGATIEEQSAWVEEELRGGRTVERLPIERVSREDAALPLSFAQQRLWFLNQLEPDNPFYNVPLALHLSGRLYVNVLEQVFNEIIRRHEVLRTTFGTLDGRPVQIVSPEMRLKFRVVHLDHLSEEERDEEVGRLSRTEAREPFDLSKGPLLRVKLLKVGEEEHVLLLMMHHIISDGWSMGVLIRELTEIYSSLIAGEIPSLAPLPIQYADFAHWQREWLQGEVLEGQLSYWKKQLSGSSGILELPTDRPRPSVQSYRGSTYSFVLPMSLRKELHHLSRSEGVTLYMTLLAAWQTLLARYSGQQDIIVGTPVANRNRADTEGLIGCFLNTLAMRSDLSGNPPFRQLLAQVRETALGAFANQDVPFEMLVEELQPERNLALTPLFQVMFTLHNAPMPSMEFAGLNLELLTISSETSKLDLVLNLTEDEQGLTGLVEYNTDLFDVANIKRMMEHFETLLGSVTAHPELPVKEQPLLTAAEERHWLVDWNNTKRDFELVHCIHELFEAQAKESPDATAIIFEDESLIYEELNRRANQLAHFLRQQGVGRNECVGLCLEHSIETVVAILGVLKAGAVYVPVDPEHPQWRQAFILRDAQASILLTQRRLHEMLPETDAKVVCLDTDWELLAVQGEENLALEIEASDLAYIIYTSGSTGEPKGVKIEHRSLLNYIQWAAEVYQRKDRTAWALYSSLAFDLTITSIFTPLITGNSLFVYRKQEQETSIFNVMADNQVGILKLTPSHLMLIKDRDNSRSQIKRLIVGGEALTTDLALQVLESFAGRVEIYNEYGPTEATVGCMIHRFDPEADQRSAVPIGKPAANLQIYLLDEDLRPVAENVIGELYISGVGLAQGYLKRDDLTCESFIDNPFISGQRMYRSGDHVRRLIGGDLEYLGRGDEQVKFHGYRIELNEVRSALNQHPRVVDSVAVMLKDENNHDLMAAYYVAEREQPASELRDWLSESMIEETIPNFFVHLNELPLTINGKIDYAALPQLEEIKQKVKSTQDGTLKPIEELLAGIWAEVLGLESDQVGAQDNFFGLGGHSLLAILVVSRVRDLFRVDLPVRSLFQSPTLAQFAATLEPHLRTGGSVQDLPMERVSREEELPLSFAQQRLWFLSQLEPDNPFYNVPLALHFSGRLYINALEQVFNQIISRHEVLRTTFSTREGRPVQMVAAQLPLKLRVVHLEHLSEEEQQVEVERLSGMEARQPFDLSVGPLIRVKLLKLGEEEHVLLLIMHHIISDGWSMSVLIKELAALYKAFVSGVSSPFVELKIQYADFAHWQRQWLQGEVLEGQLEYWKKQLQGSSGVLELPTDRPRPPVQSYRGAIILYEFPAELTARLKDVSQRSGVTLFMTLLAAFSVLLHRYTGQDDLLIASPTANRNRPEIENLIGFFVNALLMRCDLSGDPTFEELLQRVREVALEAYANQDVPFERLVEELRPERDLSRHPLFQVIFSLQDVSLDQLKLPGLKLKTLPMDSQTSMFDLTLLMQEKTDGLSTTVQYNTDLFDAETIRRMMACFQTLLEGIVRDQKERVSMLPLLSPAEQQKLLEDWSGHRTDYGPQRNVAEAFEAQVEKTPDSVAIVCADLTLRYAELNARANQLAYYLQSSGVGPETLVGLFMERSVEMIVGLLGILKAGAAYVPLDTAYPQERLETIMREAQISLLLTQRSLTSTFESQPTSSICLDAAWEKIALESADNPINRINLASPDSLAYVMYTSGSTGKPKGISITHRSILRLVKATNYVTLSADDVFLQLAPIAFDASTFEVWGALLNGARLNIMPVQSPSLQQIGQTLQNSGVTTLWLTASLFHLMVDEHLDDLRGLRQLLAGGDVLSVEHVKRFLAGVPGCRLINGYGPTENTTFTCCYPMHGSVQLSNSVPIGHPINNTEVYLLDGQMHPVPIGVPGELYTGGDGLARGYLNEPQLTAERFLPHPFSPLPGARLYRTGDLARYLPRGEIEFIGRNDQQVKLRGFRIEPAEIEMLLQQHASVRDCAVVVREDERGEKRLVAYLVPDGEAGQETEQEWKQWRSYLQQRLPEYMLPQAYVQLAELPLTPNGKLDRNALPAPRWEVEEAGERLLPRSASEELVAGAWAEVLGIEIERLGVEDDFFEMGGHSLLATQIVSRMRSVFGVEMPVREVFQRPTIREQAAWVEGEMRKGESVERLPMERVSRAEALPLSFAQQRLWFLDQLSPGTTAYNIFASMAFQGPLDMMALEKSVNEVLRRHEVLRTTFSVVDDQPVQIISQSRSVTLPVRDLSGYDESARPGEIRRLAREEMQRPFDLSMGPLLRMKLLRLSEQEHLLFFSMHHIISDGWSEGILFKEVEDLYTAFSASEPAPLADLPIQYADFAVWQRRWLQGQTLEALLSYWKKQLDGAPAVLALPTDKPRPPVQTYAGARQTHLINGELTKELKALCQRESVTLFMLLLAAYQTLLARYSGQDEIVVGSPIAGRNRSEAEGLIGFFVNTLALRGDLSQDPSFSGLLRRVREVALSAYEHQDLPFEKLVEELNLERDLSRSALFQVYFNLLNTSDHPYKIQKRNVDVLQPSPGDEPVSESAKFDLSLYALSQNGQLRLDLVYSTDLFEAATIARMLGHFETLLRSIVAKPESRLSTLEIVTETEREQLLKRRNVVRPETAFRRFEREALEQTLAARFKEQVRLYPQHVALKSRNCRWTYEELDRMSDQVAHVADKLPPRVALLFEHDAQMVLGLLGVLKTGKTYIPLDPHYPEERLSFILKDSEAGAVLTNSRNVETAQRLAGAGLLIVNIDDLQDSAFRETYEPKATPESVAYILYTSGSAGEPKGIVQNHRNVLHHIRSYTNSIRISAGDKLTLLSSYSFDAAVMDIYGALLNGATLCPFSIKDEGLAQFSTWLVHEEITVYHSTPTVYRYFTRALEGNEDFSRIRLVVLGGEEVTRKDFDLYGKHFSPNCIFVNGLGPTESTVALQYMLDKQAVLNGNRVPVGYPVEDTEVLLVNEQREEVAVYSVGEIAIRSPYVAIGYWQRPNLTERAFAPDGDKRIYYTGDVGRRLLDGSIEFLGRRDFQAKIRGYKVDFSEIEAGLLKNGSVKEVVVVAAQDGAGETRLAAYLVCDRSRTPTIEELRGSLSEQLPDYMIPDAFVMLDRVPLTPTGKLDRRALPAPDWGRSAKARDFVAPLTPVEETLTGIWAEVLGLDELKISTHDNFFELGGHSLLATLVISRVLEAFGVKIPLGVFFNQPTIAEFSEGLLENLIEQGDSGELEQLLAETGSFPVTT